MPSFSRAISMIGRFLAACAISMSDFGLACCEARHRGLFAVDLAGAAVRRIHENLVPELSLAVAGEFAGRDLRAVGAVARA